MKCKWENERQNKETLEQIQTKRLRGARLNLIIEKDEIKWDYFLKLKYS